MRPAEETDYRLETTGRQKAQPEARTNAWTNVKPSLNPAPSRTALPWTAVDSVGSDVSA